MIYIAYSNFVAVTAKLFTGTIGRENKIVTVQQKSTMVCDRF